MQSGQKGKHFARRLSIAVAYNIHLGEIASVWLLIRQKSSLMQASQIINSL